MDFPSWLKKKYKKSNDRFGDLTNGLLKVMRTNPLEEEFDDYTTLEDWLEHMEMHIAPKDVVETLIDAWSIYVTGENSEIECIRGVLEEE
jgi:mRNA-degrading endonuclease YafQ of YafQ-DinJ toxin-antitoxin module